MLSLAPEAGTVASSRAAWPGIGPFLGLLIAWGDRRPRTVALTAGAGAGLVAATLAGGLTAPTGVAQGLGTLGGALIAFRRLGGETRRPSLFDRASGLGGFVRAVAPAVLLPAMLTVATDGWFAGVAGYGITLLLVLLITPAVTLVARRSTLPVIVRHGAKAIRPALLLAGGGALVAATFTVDAPPLSFLALAAVLAAALRLGTTGAALMAAIVALATVRAGSVGAGPFALAHMSPAALTLTEVLFLACCFATGLPLALLLERRARENRKSRALAERLCTVVENNGDVLFLLDGMGRWTYLNPAWQALSGLPPERSLGRSWLERVEADDRETLDRQAAALLGGTGGAFRHTLRFQAPGGLRWVELFLQPVGDAHGRPAGAAGSLRDIDDRKRLEEHTLTARRAAEQRAREATLLASTDELTGIANRRAFLHQLDREIEAAIDYGWPLAVALFDVDHFKAVNDRFGHPVGDRVLQHIAARAVASVRGGDLVGRLGGEEFGILMPGSSAAEAAIVAERLRRAVQMPAVDGQALPSVTVSIGIAQREDQRAAETLLATADCALYIAKGEGRNRIRVAAA